MEDVHTAVDGAASQRAVSLVAAPRRRMLALAAAAAIAAAPGSPVAGPAAGAAADADPARSAARPFNEARLQVGAALGALPRIGVNLGAPTSWGAEQLMANVLRNPGLEPAVDGALVIAAAVDRDAVEDDTTWTARPPGFWAGAGFEVLSGPAAGARGRVIDNRRLDGRADRLRLDPMPASLRRGDVIALRGAQDAVVAPLWWPEGAVASVADPRPGSAGGHSLRLRAGPGSPARLRHHLDTLGPRAGKLLPVQGRWRLSLWVRGVDPGAVLQIGFGRGGRAAWLRHTLQPRPGWQLVSLAFEAVDDGPPGPLTLEISAHDAEIGIDDLSLAPDSVPAPGGFRPEVLQTLRALQPGYLRDWQGQLGDGPAQRLAGPTGRGPSRYRPGAHELRFGYALPDFLALCAAVGARPWVVLPATATPDEARAFGQALRAAWRTHAFDEIVVEHGNEHWNPLFRPAGIADVARLAEVAARSFAALRAGAGPEVPLHTVLGARHGDADAARRLARAPGVDAVAVAPYFHFRQEAHDLPADARRRALTETDAPLRRVAAAVAPRALDVYEVNLHTTYGSADGAQRDAVVTSAEAGAALMRRLLQAAALGVTRQAVYSLAGYDTFIEGAERRTVQLFGITRDLAGAGHWRATGRAVVALNAIAGGHAAIARCTGPGCAGLTALAFDAGRRWALVNASAQALHATLPCTATLRLVGDDGAAGLAHCSDGQARVEVPAGAWRTAAP